MRYRREDGCRAWLTYPLIDPCVLQELLAEGGSAEAIYDEFLRSAGASLKDRIPPDKLRILRERSASGKMHQMMQTMQQYDMGILSLEDYAYPDALRNIDDPPALLFYIGDPSCLERKCFTMVGSRTPSLKALNVAHELSRDLSAQGISIVSGLAMGIDAASHEGCLEGGSPTIAVCGCGLDIPYPADNMQLRRQIVSSGGILLSEFAPGTPALGWHFTVRNRIISGLSRGTMMVECKIKSGSMSTVQHALDQGRDVFAWPGEPGSVWAEGAHQLIREGARYATSAGDILEDLGWQDLSLPKPEAKDSLPPLTPEQHKIVTVLHQGEKSMDELAAQTGLDVSTLSISLTMLQLSGVIRSLPGKIFALI